MDIRLLSFPSGAAEATGSTIIIDVFRAFSTAAFALASGAAEIVMVAELDEALALKTLGRVDLTIGEREGLKPDGFDFGNSPTAMEYGDLAGKRLAQTTSNGTAAMVAAKGAARRFAGSFVNLSATVAAAAADTENLSIVAAGRKGVAKADEDELCASLMRTRAEGRTFDGNAFRAFTASWFLTDDYLGPRLKFGPARDWELALDLDRFDFAIEVRQEEGLLVARACRGSSIA